MDDAKKIKQDWEKAVGRRFLDLIADMGMNTADFASAWGVAVGWPTVKAAKMALVDREKPDIYYAVRFAGVFGINTNYLLCQRDDLENCVEPHGRYADKRALATKLKA